MRSGSGPMAWRFAAYHVGHAAATAALLRLPGKCARAIVHRQSPGRTTYHRGGDGCAVGGGADCATGRSSEGGVQVGDGG